MERRKSIWANFSCINWSTAKTGREMHPCGITVCTREPCRPAHHVRCDRISQLAKCSATRAKSAGLFQRKSKFKDILYRHINNRYRRLVTFHKLCDRDWSGWQINFAANHWSSSKLKRVCLLLNKLCQIS